MSCFHIETGCEAAGTGGDLGLYDRKRKGFLLDESRASEEEDSNQLFLQANSVSTGDIFLIGNSRIPTTKGWWV